jgi:alternate signal-mediated exported protein
MAESSPTTRRRLTALTGIGLGAALLIGGGTYALWSSTATFTNTGTVTAGQLVLERSTVTAYDISTDRADVAPIDELGGTPGHAIDSLLTWRAVPGDKVALVYRVEGKLVGDNLVAELDLTSLTASTDFDDVVALEYQIFNLGVDLSEAEAEGAEESESEAEPKLIGTALTDPIALDGDSIDAPLAYIQASADGQSAGLNDTYSDALATTLGLDTGTTIPLVKSGGSIHFVVALYVTFSQDAGEGLQTEDIATLEGLEVTLTQVRNPEISALFVDNG